VDSSSTFGNSKVEPNDIGLVDIFWESSNVDLIGELDVGLTSKERYGVLQHVKIYHWKGQHFAHNKAKWVYKCDIKSNSVGKPCKTCP